MPNNELEEILEEVKKNWLEYDYIRNPEGEWKTLLAPAITKVYQSATAAESERWKAKIKGMEKKLDLGLAEGGDVAEMYYDRDYGYNQALNDLLNSSPSQSV